MSAPLETLQKLPFLSDLAAGTLAPLASAAQERTVSRREVVVNKGDTLKFFPFVLEGRLQGIDFTLDGREVGLYFVGPGEYFGELSLIDRQPAAETVIALTASRLLFLPREASRQLMFDTPEAAERLALRMALRLRGEAEQRLLLALPNPMQRLCAQLLKLTRNSESGTSETFIPHAPTHQEIAIMINASRETVTRAFQQLQNQQILRRDGSQLLILDAAQLTRFAFGQD